MTQPISFVMRTLRLLWKLFKEEQKCYKMLDNMKAVFELCLITNSQRYIHRDAVRMLGLLAADKLKDREGKGHRPETSFYQN